MASKELISISTPDLEAEVSKRSILSYIAYGFFMPGGVTSVVNTGTNAIADRHELFLISLVCLVTTPVVYGIFSKINNGRLKSLDEEINLRKGQLRFWDNKGNPRLGYTQTIEFTG